MLNAITDNLVSGLTESIAERVIRQLFEQAGVEIDGNEPHDMQVHDQRIYRRLLWDGSLGMGETYMDGWWDAESLDGCLARLIAHKEDMEARLPRGPRLLLNQVRGRLANRQRRQRAFEVGERHYDIGNDLYEAMLDRRLAYTCAYFRDTDDLDAAQEAKLDLVCRKIGIEERTRVLELGCGWGSFARYAAETYGVEVTGVTVSKAQVELARERCRGLPVDIRLADYRDVSGTYDAVVSIGIMEHVGPKNYRTYMEVADRCLADGGAAFVHTIGGNRSREYVDPFYEEYVFPNAVIPSLANLTRAMEGLFVLEDLHNIGPHYDRTLLCWCDNFERAWPELSRRYDERFRRMWRYYLLSAAACFRVRYLQLWQMVLTPIGASQPDCRYS